MVRQAWSGSFFGGGEGNQSVIPDQYGVMCGDFFAVLRTKRISMCSIVVTTLNNFIFFNSNVFGESLLVDDNGGVVVRLARPLKSLSEEEVGFSHEVEFDALGE